MSLLSPHIVTLSLVPLLALVTGCGSSDSDTTASGASTGGSGGDGAMAMGGSGGNATASGGDGTGGTGGAPEPPPPPVANACITDVTPGVQSLNCEGLDFILSVPDSCLDVACGLIVDVHGLGMTAEIMNAHTDM